ncbi:MAG: U32 family peptidase [Clostridia bacterium]|nr:U32 family peptidase [Clostridia bacterium]
MQKFKDAEILSPAGNFEMLEAAVRSGADAVYLGAKDFSARRNAQNFDLKELNEAIKYCHIRGVKVYLTLNIALKENELTDAFYLAQNAYNMGIDGIILSDLGLAKLLKDNIPDLPLHASTQTSVHSVSALEILKELGFCQVVVAREMSKQELEVFCKRANELEIKVEVFVHGALCMSVSGQCLLSAYLGSRSGNRGLCAGPCRLAFKAKNGTGYDLSLKDLSLLEYLGELYNMGVRSFKIEGRMKRPEYVAAATSAAKFSLYNGFINKELDETLKNVFSRSGFTNGYYTDNLGRDMFGIRTKEDVLNANKAFPLLHELYRNERQSVKIELKAEVKENSPVTLWGFNGENEVSVKGLVPQKAQNRPTSADDIKKAISKLGSTPYYCENFEISVEDGLFVSQSELNSLRRKLCEKLNEKRAEIKRKPSDITLSNFETYKKSDKTPGLLIRVQNKNQIPENLSGIKAIIYPLEENSEIINKYNIPFIADIPRGIKDEKVILNLLKKFKENGGKAAFCGNIALIELCKKVNIIPLADTSLNVYNSETATVFESLGVKALTLSGEQELSDIKNINSSLKKGIISYGNIPLMLFKNCPIKNGISCSSCDKKGFLTDRMGIEFPVRCRLGYSELFNSLPIWLADRLADLNGLDYHILYFTNETPERAREVISAYKKELSPDVKHTRGLYYRGVL